MNHAQMILNALDARLNGTVELTLYGRAALQLGFEDPPVDCAVSHDVDAVFWAGQAQALADTSNFWEAIEAVNAELADQELYISHFFQEDQVVLTPEWRAQRCSIAGGWRNLSLYRLGNGDLLLSKLMRDDPIDHADARFVVSRAGFSAHDVRRLLERARVPDLPEIAEHFERASRRLLDALGNPVGS